MDNFQLCLTVQHDHQDVDSDATLTDDPRQNNSASTAGRGGATDEIAATMGGDQSDNTADVDEERRRVVPPPLADWNRSQSFPQGNGELQKTLRYF